MSIKERIEQDLKAALLAGEKDKTTTLRGLKSAILNAEIAKGVRDSGLTEEEVIAVLSKEAKNRQESADLYKQGGNSERQHAELAEKDLIDSYLPPQMSETKIINVIDGVLQEMKDVTPQQVGEIIARVRQQTGANADGATVARLVKERLQQ